MSREDEDAPVKIKMNDVSKSKPKYEKPGPRDLKWYEAIPVINIIYDIFCISPKDSEAAMKLLELAGILSVFLLGISITLQTAYGFDDFQNIRTRFADPAQNYSLWWKMVCPDCDYDIVTNFSITCTQSIAKLLAVTLTSIICLTLTATTEFDKETKKQNQKIVDIWWKMAGRFMILLMAILLITATMDTIVAWRLSFAMSFPDPLIHQSKYLDPKSPANYVTDYHYWPIMVSIFLPIVVQSISMMIINRWTDQK